MNQKNLEPNYQSILNHINALFADCPDGLIELAYTPSDSKALNKAEFFKTSEIEKAARFACDINKKEGVNVYIGAALRGPNTAPFARSNNEDYYLATHAWVDLDDANSAKSAKEKYKDIPPSFVVVTGRHPDLRAQAWWKLDNAESDKARLKATLANLCHALDGDKAVVDPIRVMRLGGTIAWAKKEGRKPEMTEFITPKDASKQVSIDGINRYFPPVSIPADKLSAGGVVGLSIQHKPILNIFENTWTPEKISELLDHIHPDESYEQWVQIGMALKDYNMPFTLWDAWSQKGAKYNQQEMAQKWQSFKGTGVSIGSLVHIAQKGGWKPQQRQSYNVPQAVQYAPQIIETVDPVTGEIVESQRESKFKLLYADDIQPVTESTDFVEDLLRDNEFSVIYGESNCGKTFFMLDLAMHVALGKEWRGKQVEQGGVIYAALEGGHGTRNRIAAFKKHYNLNVLIPLAVIPSNLNFLDTNGDIQELSCAIQEAKSRLGNVKLIVIDTLARAISGGDENSSMDMGQLIINADILRSITGAHIAFIHHSGKDSAKGARGHSSLRAAVDTEIEISRFDTMSPSSIKIVKQREMEMIDEMAFTLSRIELGTNQRGKPVTSCVVLPSDVQEKQHDIRLTAIQQFVYDALIESLIRYGVERDVQKDMPRVKCVSYDEMRIVLEDRGYKEMMEESKKTTSEQIKSATQSARVALKRAGKINFDGRFVWAV
jgi:AAA domain/Primase C terminal 2 (PriCT-2)/RepB DNA-primase from phage plasmid